jgi:hypothetical protein
MHHPCAELPIAGILQSAMIMERHDGFILSTDWIFECGIKDRNYSNKRGHETIKVFFKQENSTRETDLLPGNNVPGLNRAGRAKQSASPYGYQQ